MRTILLTMLFLLAVKCFAQVSTMNNPDRYPTQINKWFTDSIDGRPTSYYLNHTGIDKYSKLFYQGKFAVSDDDFTFAFLDSITTTNDDKRKFYIYTLNSVLKLADGALAEVMGQYCRSFLEKYPCEFIELKYNKLYTDNYDVWINFAGLEYYFADDPIKSVNSSIENLKIIVELNCTREKGELDLIRVKLINYIQENDDQK